MQNSCKAPQCEYSTRWKKCVKPNCYNEALAWCKRNNIEYKICKQNYNKEEATREACNRYLEKIQTKKVKRPRKSQKKAKPLSASSLKSSSSKNKHVFVKDVYSPDTAAGKITRFIQRTVMHRSETLENRVNYHKSVLYYLKNVPYYNCLTPRKYTDKDGATHTGFDLDSTLKLVKKIGTKSAFGAIYQTAARSTILSVATKLMPVNDRNKQEIILNTTSTSLVINKISKHFLISHMTFKCNKKSSSIDYPQIIRNKHYYVTLNELAHGDLHDLCHNKSFF